MNVDPIKFGLMFPNGDIIFSIRLGQIRKS